MQRLPNNDRPSYELGLVHILSVTTPFMTLAVVADDVNEPLLI